MCNGMTVNPRPRVVLIGAGRLARALMRTIPNLVVGVVVRPGATLRNGDPSDSIRVIDALDSLRNIDFDTAWILVQDRLIAGVADELSRVPLDWSGRLIMHSSGAGTAKAMLALANLGSVTAVVHPNGTFSGNAPIPEDLFWGISSEIDDAALERVNDVLGPMRPRLIRVRDADRELYHAAASVSSNYVALLVTMAHDLYVRAGIDSATAREVVASFVEQVNRNAVEVGGRGAITGPIVRGDTEVVRGHIEAIERRAPEWLPLALALARATAMRVGTELGGLEETQ